MAYLLIVLSFLITKIIIMPLHDLLLNNGAVKRNYINMEIPIGLGIAVVLGAVPSLILLDYIDKSINLAYFLILLIIAFTVGFIDDFLGNHDTKGIRGHFKVLFTEKKLTTGALKAIVISSFSFLIAYIYARNGINLFLDFFILVLATNSLNLLDVCPGRAVKYFVLVAFLMILVIPSSRLFLSIILISVAVYFPLDLKSIGMLGDAGANFLGMVVGVAFVLFLTVKIKLAIVFFLFMLHYYTEKHSLSVLINKVYILRVLDNWGR